MVIKRDGQGTALLTDAIEVGAQRVVCEVLLPQAGREELDFQGGMGIDALEHIDQIDVGIDALQTTRREQTVDNPHMAGADFRPTEQPVFAAQGNGPNFPLQMIGIHRHVGINQEHFEFCLPLQCILRRVAKRIGGEQDSSDHCLFEPRKEILHEGFLYFPPMRQFGLCCYAPLTDHRFLFIERSNSVECGGH